MPSMALRARFMLADGIDDVLAVALDLLGGALALALVLVGERRLAAWPTADWWRRIFSSCFCMFSRAAWVLAGVSSAWPSTSSLPEAIFRASRTRTWPRLIRSCSSWTYQGAMGLLSTNSSTERSPASMRLAISISPSRVSRAMEPILRRYMRIGSLEVTASSLLVVAFGEGFAHGRLGPDRRQPPRLAASVAVSSSTPSSRSICSQDAMSLGSTRVWREELLELLLGDVSLALPEGNQLLSKLIDVDPSLGRHRVVPVSVVLVARRSGECPTVGAYERLL